MESIMELDDLKLAWQTLDRRIEQHNSLNLQLFRDSKLDRARSRLRPLYWGQIIQIIAGALVTLMAGSFWTHHREVTHLLIAGLIVHVYGVLMILLGARTLWLINQIDYAAPVVTIQKQLAQLRSFHIRNGIWAGLPWWLLWMPFMMMFFMGQFGADMYANAPAVIYGGTAIGVVGLLATWWFHRWSRDPSHPRLAKFVQDSVTGASLRRAQVELDEIVRFEQERG